MAKAFARVWHEGLLHKLALNFSESLYQLMKSYLSDRFFRVNIGNHLYEPITIKAGVPQGSILGPSLYILNAKTLLILRFSYRRLNQAWKQLKLQGWRVITMI